MIPRLLVFCLVGLVLPGHALAQPTAELRAGESPADEPSAAPVELGWNALPGLARLPSATPTAGLTLTSYAGYGFHGAVLGADDAHHRMAGILAIGYGFGRHLSASLRLDGRYDRHTDAPEGDDDGWVGDPRLALRGVTALRPDLYVGAQLGVWLPGDTAPSLVLSAVSFDATALGTWAPPALPVAITANLGVRLDRSAASVPDPDSLSLADRMALGVSDSSALLVGIGAVHQRGRLALLGEVSADLLLGAAAPPLGQSPMRVGLGGRYAIASDVALGLWSELSLAGDPDIMRGAPLVPVEPRVSLLAGLHYRPQARAPRGHGSLSDRLGDGGDAPPPPPATARLSGRARTSAGLPVADAEVRLEAGEVVETTRTDADGNFVFERAPVGPATLTIRGADHEEVVMRVELGAGQPVEVQIALEPVLPRGQLRGLIRSMAGKSLQATLRLEPLGLDVTTDAQGAFEVDVPPGRYQVIVRAAGFAEQQREVVIEERGVTILNVDLRRGR